jgi:hypothetical protein
LEIDGEQAGRGNGEGVVGTGVLGLGSHHGQAVGMPLRCYSLVKQEVAGLEGRNNQMIVENKRAQDVGQMQMRKDGQDDVVFVSRGRRSICDKVDKTRWLAVGDLGEATTEVPY